MCSDYTWTQTAGGKNAIHVERKADFAAALGAGWMVLGAVAGSRGHVALRVHEDFDHIYDIRGGRDLAAGGCMTGTLLGEGGQRITASDCLGHYMTTFVDNSGMDSQATVISCSSQLTYTGDMHRHLPVYMHGIYMQASRALQTCNLSPNSLIK